MSEPIAAFGDSGIMNYALRMVIPMKREFGRSIDVQHFLHDFAYAKEVLDEARQSQNPKLREYAEYLDSRMMGPRHVAPRAPAARQASSSENVLSSSTSSDHQATLNDEEEAKQLVLAKYRAGLR
jgi:hypothetical protein